MESAVIAVIGSLARGDENHIKSLTAAGVIPFLLNSNILIIHQKFQTVHVLKYYQIDVCASTNPQVIEFALRALQQLFQNEATKTDLLFADSRLVPQLLKLMPLSVCNQISVTSIFTNACKVRQTILCPWLAHFQILHGLDFDRRLNIKQSCAPTGQYLP